MKRYGINLITMKTEELKKVAERAKQIAVAIYGINGDKDFSTVQIDEYGDVSVLFSSYRFGETEERTIYLSEDDMNGEVEQVLTRHKEKEKRDSELREKHRLESERRQRELEEQDERRKYERLKAKFEPK